MTIGAAFLDADLTTAAICWRLERRDGVTIGFTSHDRDLEIAGLVYRAAPGMLPSAISQTDGFAADALDIQGALTSDAIRGVDLKAGRWDGAALNVFMTDWTAPGIAMLPLARGVLGEVSVRGDGFEAELRGPATLLERSVVGQTSPECRANLGDKRCRIDMAGRTMLTRIADVVSDDVVQVGNGADGNAYGNGMLRWIGGGNSGLASAILNSDGARIVLVEPPAHEPVPGDLVLLREGCDKSLATCAGRFANAINFRGEPHLPGIDLLTRYPGA
jgi:uncharacterized phage protein (TIGR02218 family)